MLRQLAMEQLLRRRDAATDPECRGACVALLGNLAAGALAGSYLGLGSVGDEPPAAPAPGTVDAGERAAHDFSNLVSEVIALRLLIDDNADQFSVEFHRSFKTWVASLERFGRNVAGMDIPWWDFPRQMATSFRANYWKKEEIYNQVQVFRQEFRKYHDEVERTLGVKPLGVPPERPSPHLSVTPTADWIKDLAGTALTIVLIGGVAYVVGSAVSGRGTALALQLPPSPKAGSGGRK